MCDCQKNIVMCGTKIIMTELWENTYVAKNGIIAMVIIIMWVNIYKKDRCEGIYVAEACKRGKRVSKTDILWRRP